MTNEQIIILAFLAAAFCAGWLARALVGGARRPAVSPAGSGPEAVAEAAPRLEGVVNESRHELTRAIRAYHAAVVGSLPNGRENRSGGSALEVLAGALVALSGAVDHASRELEAQDPLAARLQSTGLELRRLADDVMRHSREQELPAGVFDRLEQNLISAASMIFAPGRLEARAT